VGSILRIKEHPIIDFKDQKKISFYFNDKKLYGYEGDSIASALHATGIKKLTTSLRYDRPRGFFCGIGKCSSCLMRVNEVPNVRTCIAPLKDGINVETQGRPPGLPDAEFVERPKETVDVDIFVVGAGPAGLCAGLESAKQGARVLLVDENQRVGGQLIKQTHKFFGSKQEKAGTRGIEIAIELRNELKEFEKNGRITVMLDATVIGYYEGSGEKHKFGVVKRIGYESRLYEVVCKAVVFACGAMENMLLFPGNDLPGVYGAGAVQTLMNVYGVKPGEKVVMVGAGNVGLIVSYQLLQADIEVDRIVEVASKVGGYHVHAAKLRRCGVPIYTSHSIKEAYGNGRVEGAVVVAVDDCFQPIRDSEEDVPCDTICLAVGLTPSIRLLEQIGVRTEFIPETGGNVAIHDSSMQTNVQGVYVAGDSSGIEEASTAMIEGQLAGVSAAAQLGYDKNARAVQRQCRNALRVFRSGPFGDIPGIGKEKIAYCWKRRS
jgi:sarcosine oxidase subunit alpha